MITGADALTRDLIGRVPTGSPQVGTLMTEYQIFGVVFCLPLPVLTLRMAARYTCTQLHTAPAPYCREKITGCEQSTGDK